MIPEILKVRMSRRKLLQDIALAVSALVISSTIGCGEENHRKIPEGFDFEFSTELIRLTNQLRMQNGFNPLKIHLSLTLAAQNYSEVLAQNDYFAHEGPDGSLPWDRMAAEGFNYNTWKGENLVKGDIDYDPQGLFDVLVKSEGHKANMLNPNYKFIGVSCYVRNLSYPIRLCVQEFGGEYTEQ